MRFDPAGGASLPRVSQYQVGNMNTLILYHANCNDGFCAAWVANMVFGDEAEYLPVNYGQPAPDVAGREVYILDFSYKRPVMIELTQRAKKLVCLDHHKTAAEELAGLSAGSDEGLIRFDMDKSGGRLAWEYFWRTRWSNEPCVGVLIGGKLCNEKTAPWLVDYTEDRDLWRWKLPTSREINAALASYPREFTCWDLLSEANRRDLLGGEGAAILRYQQQVVDGQCANAKEIDLAGHKVLSVNATVLISEIAGQLAKDRPFGATWFERADGKRVWSLRSRDGGIDVSEVAKQFGGGGHRNAAGFEA